MKNKGLAAFALLAILMLLVAVPAGAQSGSKGYLIGSENPLTAQQVRQLKNSGANVKFVFRNFGGAAAVISDANVAKVRALSFVTSVNEDPLKQPDEVILAPAASDGAPLPGTPYWQDLIDLEATAVTGKGVWVAVLDTGFYPNWRDYFHEEQILTDLATAFVAANGNQNDNQWDVGSDPHGMAVSGTIVGYRLEDRENEGGGGEGAATGSAGTYWVPGVAPDAKIIPIKVCEPIGCFGSAINAAIDYVTDLKKANPSRPIVINESLGGPGLDAVEKAAIDAAVKAGVVLVASAGNSGEFGMGFPGAYEPVISTGAGGWVDQWNEHPDKTWWLDDVPEEGVNEVFVVDFSSRALAGQYLDVVSTGRFLLLPYPCAKLYKDGEVTEGTNNRTCASKATPEGSDEAPFQYLFISGTSFSAPTISGVVALMLEVNPTLNNADADPGVLGDPGSWGAGALERALEGSATALPSSGSVLTTFRTGDDDLESWDTSCDHDGNAGTPEVPCDPVGHGWVFADDAVKAANGASSGKGKGGSNK